MLCSLKVMLLLYGIPNCTCESWTLAMIVHGTWATTYRRTLHLTVSLAVWMDLCISLPCV